MWVIFIDETFNLIPVSLWAMLLLGFTTLLKSQVISVAFYSEREKSDKFCSEALISAWDTFKWRKSTTRDPWLYVPSEGSHTQDFYALKNPSITAGFETANLGSRGKYDNHGTTEAKLNTIVNISLSKHNSFSNGLKLYADFRIVLKSWRFSIKGSLWRHIQEIRMRVISKHNYEAKFIQY